MKQSDVSQVFEIAAGFSPRGLEMTSDPNVTYVEVDLAENARLKRKIVNAIITKSTIGSRRNIYFEEGDVLDLTSLQSAIKYLDKTKPITIITEGLLRYLTFAEKTMAAKNIKVLLEQFSGTWIVSDTDLKPNSEREVIILPESFRSRKTKTGINPDLNLFISNAERQRFFERIGFTVEDHNLMEIADELVSPKRLNKTNKEIKDLFNGKHVYIMSNCVT